MKTIAILGTLAVLAVGCGDETMEPTQVDTSAASCPGILGTVSFADGTVLDCSNPAMTVTCDANDSACICKRLTGYAFATSCTPCALRYPCTQDCQCVADHGPGWACMDAATLGPSSVPTPRGCVQVQ